MNSRQRLAIGIISLVSVMLLSVIGYEYHRFTTSTVNVPTAGVTFQIEPGANLNSVSAELNRRGISSLPALYLKLYGRLSQHANALKAGEYHIQAGTSLPQLLEQFVSGKVVQYSLTIVEGMTLQQLLEQLKQHRAIISTTETQTLAEQLGIPYNSAEGWFLPETYAFPANTQDLSFLKRAYHKMQTVLAEEWQQRADDLPYKTPYESLIMASIIEKETAAAEERAKIAGVFVRRLEKGMRLQTDPTVIYGMGAQFDGNLRRKDLRKDTPYNTYTRKGLPPTPICLPGKASIHAALHPEQGEELYFVATGKDGKHVFSKTLTEHNKAVRRYQLK